MCGPWLRVGVISAIPLRPDFRAAQWGARAVRSCRGHEGRQMCCRRGRDHPVQRHVEGPTSRTRPVTPRGKRRRLGGSHRLSREAHPCRSCRHRHRLQPAAPASMASTMRAQRRMTRELVRCGNIKRIRLSGVGRQFPARVSRCRARGAEGRRVAGPSHAVGLGTQRHSWTSSGSREVGSAL